jgi:hypothetical protein
MLFNAQYEEIFNDISIVYLLNLYIKNIYIHTLFLFFTFSTRIQDVGCTLRGGQNKGINRL